MEVLNPNGQKIYNITAKKLAPEWLTEKKKRLLKKDKGTCRACLRRFLIFFWIVWN